MYNSKEGNTLEYVTKHCSEWKKMMEMFAFTCKAQIERPSCTEPEINVYSIENSAGNLQ